MFSNSTSISLMPVNREFNSNLHDSKITTVQKLQNKYFFNNRSNFQINDFERIF